MSPQSQLVDALEHFHPPFAEALRYAKPLFDALAGASDESVNDEVDAFVIGTFRLINRLQVTLDSVGGDTGFAADLIDLAAERARRQSA